MKRIFVALMLVMATLAVSAQGAATTPVADPPKVISTPKTDMLASFNRVKIDGQIVVVFKKVATANEARITYDTKGNETSKFKFDIDKKGLLTISEKSDPKRLTVTEVTIYYYALSEAKIAHAKVSFNGVVKSDIFDLFVSGGATVSLNVSTLDIAIECTGASRLTLGGSTKYLTMRASTAKIDCSTLSTVSATVEASHSAEVRLSIKERLEAKTSTGAKLLYKGKPVILRNHNVIFGGEILNVN